MHCFVECIDPAPLGQMCFNKMLSSSWELCLLHVSEQGPLDLWLLRETTKISFLASIRILYIEGKDKVKIS